MGGGKAQHTVRRSDDRSWAKGGSALQAWSIRLASSADGGAAGVVDARPPAVEWPSDCEMACRRARWTMPRRSCSNFSEETLPPVALSVSLKTSTAVWPRVLMLAATTETFATLSGGATARQPATTASVRGVAAPKGLDEVGQQARAIGDLDAEHGELVAGVVGERLRRGASCSSHLGSCAAGAHAAGKHTPPHRRPPPPCGPGSVA